MQAQSTTPEPTITVRSTGERITLKQALAMMVDRAEELGATADDAGGLVRDLVEANSLGFNAWFCICVDLANRSAQREGYANQYARAWAQIEAAKIEGEAR